jgi:hypothetical protein
MTAADPDVLMGLQRPPLVRQNCDVADQDEQMVSLTFSKSDWRLVQEALDNEYYETEHWEPGGWTTARRARNRQHRETRLDRLRHLDKAIGDATGLGLL